MGRSFSRAPEAKKQAILAAAVEIVAEQGLTASTRQIAQAAGVSEGTIFNHFVHKDDLLNALYLYIRQNWQAYLEKARLLLLTGRSTSDLDLSRAGIEGLHDRFRFLWSCYVEWGLERPAYIKTLDRLTPTGKLTRETRFKSVKLFPILGEILVGLWTIQDGDDIEKHWQDIFVYQVIMSVSNTTVSMIHSRSEAAQEGDFEEEKQRLYEAGFSILWKGLLGLVKDKFFAENVQKTYQEFFDGAGPKQSSKVSFLNNLKVENPHGKVKVSSDKMRQMKDLL
ncbi:TetR/AcrR family transcriptional regulator [Acetobacteraceae bacterium]|nr:TetR/AcrR family transcriptional regulator [Acetobacteraceae bacterium]